MQILNKVIFWVSIVVILTWMMLSLFGKLIPLEIKIGKSGGLYQVFLFYALQTAVMLTLFGTLKQKDSRRRLIIKLILTCAIAVAACFLTIVTIFSGMCSWNTDRVLLEKKDAPDTRIVLRRKGCGEQKKKYPLYKTAQEKHIIADLYWIKDIDTNQLDQKQWNRLNP
ncbi:heme/copper-type cytochrome/quinol oxidase subunit 4 [Pedobacter cryoconitis]|uniref:hypothetical protein n=1 Tax=Pedobacter cryoconitis TaxID=188932 RepID=UPI0016123B3F|nr:hypothetical protein [Pedobacter cryoconitis]MBB6269893.1 heme/copper-type cytochrome/quinol oxidase subunit 4 [Pedobacter cryoconitis]